MFTGIEESEDQKTFRAEEAASVIQSNSQVIAEKVVRNIFSANPEVWDKYGQKGFELSVRDTESHIPYLVEAVRSSDFTIFTDYILWARQLFQSLNMPENTMIETVSELKNVSDLYLDDDQKPLVQPVFTAAENANHQPLQIGDSYILQSNPLYVELKSFFEALMDADRRKAGQIIFDAVDRGVSIKDIYIYVFQVSQYEVGRLWQENKISVAKEHFASAATQQIMSQLYPKIFTGERNGGKMVAANIGGDLHEMGIRMVADFFEMEGWDTFFLGANTPLDSMMDSVREFSPDLLALSASLPFHRSRMKDFVAMIKEEFPETHVMIGGRAVKNGKDDLNYFGADSYGSSAREAVVIARDLI